MSELGQFDGIWVLLVTVRGPGAPHVIFCQWVAGQCPGSQEVWIFFFFGAPPPPHSTLGGSSAMPEVLRSVWWQILNSDQARAVSRVLAPSQHFLRKKTESGCLEEPDTNVL